MTDYQTIREVLDAYSSLHKNLAQVESMNLLLDNGLPETGEYDQNEIVLNTIHTARNSASVDLNFMLDKAQQVEHLFMRKTAEELTERARKRLSEFDRQPDD